MDGTLLHHIGDAGQPGEVDIGQAAKILGTTPAALRKRIRRGTLAAHKRLGLWYVTLPAGQDAGMSQTSHRAEDAGPDAGSPTGRPAGQDADSSLVDALRDEVRWLRSELERRDSLLAAFAARLPELPSGRATSEDQAAPEPAQPKRRGWWFWRRSD